MEEELAMQVPCMGLRGITSMITASQPRNLDTCMSSKGSIALLKQEKEAKRDQKGATCQL